MNIKKKVENILKIFEKENPIPKTELNYIDPYQLIVSVILSAQCTDKRVNLVTPNFFKTFPNYESLKDASFESVFNLIRSISYPNNKSKSLIKMAEIVYTKYNNILPEKIEELETIAGVGRKTANVLASVLYNAPVLAVDTHVFRVSKRIGLVPNEIKSPIKCEETLTPLFKKDLIPKVHHWLILHGRYTCKAKNPNCKECKISEFCDFYLFNNKS